MNDSNEFEIKFRNLYLARSGKTEEQELKAMRAAFEAGTPVAIVSADAKTNLPKGTFPPEPQYVSTLVLFGLRALGFRNGMDVACERVGENYEIRAIPASGLPCYRGLC